MNDTPLPEEPQEPQDEAVHMADYSILRKTGKMPKTSGSYGMKKPKGAGSARKGKK
jgi:hypothetical protein